MDNLKIKIATSSDLDTVQQIGRQTFTETFAASNTAEDLREYLQQAFSSTRLRQELEDTHVTYYLAMLDEQTIGYLKVNTGPAQTDLQEADALEIQRIYVLADYHGTPVGRQLLAKAIQVAREKKVSFVWLGVWEKNPRAIRFYEKNGFVPFDQHTFLLGADKQTDILMKRIL